MTRTQPVHGYNTHLLWQGSTAAGYRTYPRQHLAVAPPAAEIRLSADPHFRGDAEFMNPEQLLVMAASSCQLLSFLALAAQQGIDVLSYEDEAHGDMPEGDPPLRLTRITLTPVVTVAAGTDRLSVNELVHEAHHSCYIANSLTSQIILEPTVLTA
jgi:organic hydroperoxide reductase OsmC/OhrA